MLEPSAWDWLNFCNLVGIDSHRTLDSGFIDLLRDFDDSFTIIPKSLKRKKVGPLVKVREILPFRQLFLKKYGESKWSSLLKDVGVDDYIFYILDYQVPVNFLYYLIEKTSAKLASPPRELVENSTRFEPPQPESTGKKVLFSYVNELVSQQTKYYSKSVQFDVTKENSQVKIDLKTKTLDSQFTKEAAYYSQYKARQVSRFLKSSNIKDLFQVETIEPPRTRNKPSASSRIIIKSHA